MEVENEVEQQELKLDEPQQGQGEASDNYVERLRAIVLNIQFPRDAIALCYEEQFDRTRKDSTVSLK